MDWGEALNLVIERTGHERYRALCADDHPQRDMWRARMIEKAAGPAPPAASYPPAARQAANLARSLYDWAVSGFSMASDEEQAHRRAICAACPRWDGARCVLCGCYTEAKIKLRTEKCPLPEPKW